MSCFNHLDKDAVGSCKNCGRALCHDCIAPELFSIACKNRCEEKVKAVDSFMQKALISKYNTTTLASLILFFMLATLSVMLYQSVDFELYGVLFGMLSLLLLFNTFRIMRRNS